MDVRSQPPKKHRLLFDQCPEPDQPGVSSPPAFYQALGEPSVELAERLSASLCGRGFPSLFCRSSANWSAFSTTSEQQGRPKCRVHRERDQRLRFDWHAADLKGINRHRSSQHPLSLLLNRRLASRHERDRPRAAVQVRSRSHPRDAHRRLATFHATHGDTPSQSRPSGVPLSLSLSLSLLRC